MTSDWPDARGLFERLTDEHRALVRSNARNWRAALWEALTGDGRISGVRELEPPFPSQPDEKARATKTWELLTAHSHALRPAPQREPLGGIGDWSARTPALAEITGVTLKLALSGSKFFELDSARTARERPQVRIIHPELTASIARHPEMAKRRNGMPRKALPIARPAMDLPYFVKTSPEVAWLAASQRALVAHGDGLVQVLETRLRNLNGDTIPIPHLYQDTGEHVFPVAPVDLVLTEVISPIMMALSQPFRIRSLAGARTVSGLERAIKTTYMVAETLGISTDPIPALLDSERDDEDYSALRESWVRSWEDVAVDLGPRALEYLSLDFRLRYRKHRSGDGRVRRENLVPASKEVLAGLLFSADEDLLAYCAGPDAVASSPQFATREPSPHFEAPSVPGPEVLPYVSTLARYLDWLANSLEERSQIGSRFDRQASADPSSLSFHRSEYETERAWRNGELPKDLRTDLDSLWPCPDSSKVGVSSSFPELRADAVRCSIQLVSSAWFTLSGPYAYPALDALDDYTHVWRDSLARDGFSLPDSIFELMNAASLVSGLSGDGAYTFNLVTVDTAFPRRGEPDGGHRSAGETSGRELMAVQAFSHSPERVPAYEDLRMAVVADFELVHARVPQLDLTTSDPQSILRDAMRLAGLAGSQWLRRYSSELAGAAWKADAHEAVQKYAQRRARYSAGLTAIQATPALRAYAAHWASGSIAMAGRQLGLDVRDPRRR